jgi:hypothetical protein
MKTKQASRETKKPKLEAAQNLYASQSTMKAREQPEKPSELILAVRPTTPTSQETNNETVSPRAIE